MAYYEELDDILNIVIGEYILKNQNICKLLYYFPEEYSLNYDPLKEPDIQDTSKLLLEHIFPLPKSPNTETKQKGFMTVVLTGGDYANTLNGYRTVNLVFDIVFHLKSWIIKNSYRPYKILEEIDKIFNNQVTTLPIQGVSKYYGFTVKDYSSAYYGIQVIYELTLNSNIECMPTPKNLNLKPSEIPENDKPIFISKVLGRENNGI
ncbi:MAG: hypothetical protein ACI4SM_00120 [Candidatus Gastranaerophilaceae bacterium]